MSSSKAPATFDGRKEETTTPNAAVTGTEPVAEVGSHEPVKETPLTEPIDHVVTQEDLDNNPDLVGEGVKVGDTITIPANTEEAKAE